MKRAALAVAMTLLPPLASTAVASTQIGSGTGSCGSWTMDRSDGRAGDIIADQQWVLGFLSGVGYVPESTVDPLNGLDAFAVWAWFDNYCQTYPLVNLTLAAWVFAITHPR